MFSNSAVRASQHLRKVSAKEEALSVLRASIQLDTGQAAHGSQAKHSRTAQTAKLLPCCLPALTQPRLTNGNKLFSALKGLCNKPTTCNTQLHSVILSLFSHTPRAPLPIPVEGPKAIAELWAWHSTISTRTMRYRDRPGHPPPIKLNKKHGCGGRYRSTCKHPSVTDCISKHGKVSHVSF